MTSEPRLNAEDIRCWESWRLAFRLRARSREFQRRLDDARRLVDRELARASSPMVSWSAGKDSTAMTHLVVVDRQRLDVQVMSEKDDLDFPGEESYVRELAAAWGARLTVVRPELSPLEWIERRAGFMDPCDDIHGRNAGLSKACFYGVMEEANRGSDLVMMGLRSEESGHRRNLRQRRGPAYTLKSGRRHVLPIVDWSGLDVFAYLEWAGIEPLPVYRCIGFMHAREPWRLRKSWWLPGRGAAHGQAAWLRRYYPSLHARYMDMYQRRAQAVS